MYRLPVRWGLSLASRGALFGLTDVEELIQTAILADQSGVFESVWVGDSLIHKPRLEAITLLAAVATHTKNVRLGTICMASFPVRHPVLLAIQWASLDQLSQGRSLLGVFWGTGVGGGVIIDGKLHPSVRIHPDEYRKLKAYLLSLAVHRSAENLSAVFRSISAFSFW